MSHCSEEQHTGCPEDTHRSLGSGAGARLRESGRRVKKAAEI